MELGTVASVDDPKGLGRVQVVVPGIIDHAGPWAPPIGTLGGGGPQRGFFAVPPVGSDVAVFFHRGDPERPYYLAGHWGQPSGGDEVPTDVEEAPADQRSKVASFETANWKMTFDDRPEESKVRIAHKALDLVIEADGKKGVVDVKGEAALNLSSNGFVNINAPNVVIGGRVVMKNGKPIG